MNERIMRLHEVMNVTGLSRSSIYLRVNEGTFPKQRKLGKRAVGWKENEIQAWIDSLINKQ